jgi:A/G-specific adenine glycosylase
MTPAKFRKIIWKHYRTRGRQHLPWRKTKGVYKILVSEVMLQQTQVDRVLPFYRNFIKKFPTAKKLAIAPLSEVLRAWQGLGYNRRAKMLHAAVQVVAKKEVNTVAELEALPGVGPYTARAVAAFAWNHDDIFIETNIRTAIIHHFFSKKKVSDKEIEKILLRVLPKGKSREWYSAVMDYGSSLKRSGISYNVRSTGYAKQAKFVGSMRQARGIVLREFTNGMRSRSRLIALLGPSRSAQMRAALTALIKEGLITESLLSKGSQ